MVINCTRIWLTFMYLHQIFLKASPMNELLKNMYQNNFPNILYFNLKVSSANEVANFRGYAERTPF